MGTLILSRRIHAVAAVAILLAAAALYSVRIGSPFEHYHENVTACYASWGRNYLRYGYAPTNGAPIKAVGIRPPSTAVVPRQIYSHRPPTVSLLLSLLVRAFGPSEAATRLLGLLASLASLVVFGLLARRLLGPTWGLAAAALLAFIPNFAFYGVAIAHQTFGVLGGLAIFQATLWWHERPGRKRLAALLGVVAAGCWLDWPAFYAAGAAGLWILLWGRERRWTGLLLPVMAVASLGLFVIYLYRLDPVELVPLKDFLSTGSGHSRSVSWGGYLASHAREAIRWFTVPVLLLAAVGSGLLRPRKSPEDAVILATVFLGADSLLFPALTSGHLFMTVPFVPFAALAAARGMQALSSWKPTLAVAAALAIGFVAQSGLVLVRAHQGGSYPYPNESSRALAETLKERTAPEERTMVRISLDKHILGFYADRPIALYLASERSIEWLDDIVVDHGIDEAAVLRLLEGHFSWFVTTTYPMASERLASVRRLSSEVPDPDAFVRENYDFESERAPSALLRRLREKYVEIRVGGFLFFDLRKPR
jgi:hypothetical protein